MASRTDRARALRRFASGMKEKLDLAEAGLIRLRLHLRDVEMDEEDRAAYEHEFESAAAALVGSINGTWETQRGRLFKLADELDAQGYGGAAAASAASAGQPAAPRGSSGQPEGWKDGVSHADPDRRETKPRRMR